MSKVARSPPQSHGQKPDPNAAGGGAPGGGEPTILRKRKQREPDHDFTAAFASFTTEIKTCINDWRNEMNHSISKISNEITSVRGDLDSLSAITSGLKDEITILRSDHTKLENNISLVQRKCSDITQEISELKSSVEFTSDQQIHLEKRLSVLETKFKSNCMIEDKTKSLEIRMDSMDQQSRQCNIEISNLPEKRGENLVEILQNIGTAIKFSIPQKDIIAIHRVPHMRSDNNTPKNVVVKFTSQTLRSNVLSAYRLAKGLTTDQVGISGAPNRIYLNEHLIISKKLLFRECRSAAKQHNYKHTWVRNGTILMRETDTSPVLKIYSSTDLKKLRARAEQNAPNAP
ncbi:unnamed protein product [Plutella xylostella]|uniref:(diamondback moth) hypothetical protein n=1 Tax=Plutella xylostella TaxID=51655 RepID=A0A8S4E344_PLUXY|nr:unnamed protein product [Plutella xylostella]